MSGDLTGFLDLLWGDQEGHAHVAFGHGPHFDERGKYRHSRWEERSFSWPADRDYLSKMVGAVVEHQDVYHGVLLRSGASRRKGDGALPGRYAWADVDGAWTGDRQQSWWYLAEAAPGSLLIGSGRARHVYAALPEALPPGELEVWNRRLADYFGADCKWAENTVLRPAGTANHKPAAAGEGAPAPVTLLEVVAGQPGTLAALDLLLPADPGAVRRNGGPVPGDLIAVGVDLDALPGELAALVAEEPGDNRSKQTYRLVCAAVRAGLDDGQVLTLARRHKPTVAKYGDRLDDQVAEVLAKVRATEDELWVREPDGGPAKKTSPPSPPAEEDVAAKAAAIRERVRRKYGTDDAVFEHLADTLARYVAFPSPAARDAVVLWAAHCHCLPAFESTPRLALRSPEKGSGKTRTLEVLEGLDPKPMHAVNCTAAALFRAVSAQQATLLFDEVDTYFGPRVAQQHEELRGLINAGHRRGAVAYRCVGDGSKQKVVAFKAYAAAALAGLGDLPDTVLDRAVVIKMRRRAPNETVEPFRRRFAGPVLRDLKERLTVWAKDHADELAAAVPDMPDGIVDRAADVWEPLLAVADAVGGDWSERARKAAVELNAARQAADPSLGVRLLADLRDTVFRTADRLWTEDILTVLTKMDEAPWGELRGKPLDARGLAGRVRRFDVGPKPVRIGPDVKKGYERADFHDAWARYLPPPSLHPQESGTSGTADTPQVEEPDPVPANGCVPDASGTPPGSGTDGNAATSTVALVPDVPLPQGREGESAEDMSCPRSTQGTGYADLDDDLFEAPAEPYLLFSMERPAPRRPHLRGSFALSGEWSRHTEGGASRVQCCASGVRPCGDGRVEGRDRGGGAATRS